MILHSAKLATLLYHACNRDSGSESLNDNIDIGVTYSPWHIVSLLEKIPRLSEAEMWNLTC